MTNLLVTIPPGDVLTVQKSDGTTILSIDSLGNMTAVNPLTLTNQTTQGSAGSISTYATITVNGTQYGLALYSLVP